VENNSESYFSLMLHGLDIQSSEEKSEKNTFFRLEEKINKFTADGYHLIFILGWFDLVKLPPPFPNNLHSLWQSNKSKIHYIFTLSRDVDGAWLQQYDQIRLLLLQNLVYFPNFTSNDTKFTIERLCQKYGYAIPETLKESVASLSGGHVDIIKVSLQLLSNKTNLNNKELFEFLNNQLEIKLIFDDIWENLEENDKNCLARIAKGDYSKITISDYLLNLKMVIVGNDIPRLFSPLFNSFVKAKNTDTKTLSFNPQDGQILVDGLPPKEKISLNEFRLLSTFLKSPNVVVSREEISEILWGKDSYEKYSDWAIDQNMSLLRKKLDSLNVSPNKIQTIKGRGYRWTE
jgi:DNA-binding winged helix-turn-helix (wHTH) protein